MISGIKPLKIGNVDIGFPVVQAALSGYSDWAMRMIARRMGASYSLCEVMLDQFLVSLKDRKKTQHFLYNTPEEHPVAGQLMGAEPEQFALGAQKLVEAGFAVIDINFGCPVRKVLGRCRGGFHLSQPAVALEIVRQTRDKVPSQIPVTIKMRRGLDDTTESRDNFYEILDGAFAYGIDAITVHGRTVQQRYIGPSRWSFLKEVKDYVGPAKTILGSGDLFSAEDCLRMMQETGVDGVTVARGCIGNPWIFEQARKIFKGEPLPAAPSVHQQRDVMLEHFRLAEELYGPERAGVPMRKFGIKYAASHPQGQIVRDDFVRVKDFDAWRAVLDRWYSDDAPGVYPSRMLYEQEQECG
ncbi:MAG: tRNA-dihydrouridine synthase family protein [Planctomycetes bacterium]|nr:tRNA-dihydrouridine synthase family protein [Planctomycetota bacterium]